MSKNPAKVDLNIDNYNLQDLLNLFKLSMMSYILIEELPTRYQRFILKKTILFLV